MESRPILLAKQYTNLTQPLLPTCLPQPRKRHSRILKRSMATEKTFYLETFGCQMNAHDSEKVIGTLRQQGYRQVESEEDAGLILYNTCSIRDKAEQKVFQSPERLQAAAQGREAFRRSWLRGAAGGREDLRAGAVRFAGLRIGFIPQTAGDAGAAGGGREANHRPGRPADGRDLRDGVYGAAESLPRLHHHH